MSSGNVNLQIPPSQDERALVKRKNCVIKKSPRLRRNGCIKKHKLFDFNCMEDNWPQLVCERFINKRTPGGVGETNNGPRTVKARQ